MKKAAAKKAAPAKTIVKETAAAAPAKAAPAEKADETVTAVTGPAAGRTPAVIEGRPAIAPRLLDRPGHAPELLAIAAVRVLGPQARDWAAQTLATYPAATREGLARLATQRFVRVAGVGGAVSRVFGLFATATELATAAWAQAALVLHVAAAYGQDPTDPERAADLLVLAGVHPSPETARAALAAAMAADPEGQPALRALEAAWRIVAPLTGQVRGWAAVRAVARRLPGMTALVAGAGNAAAAERLAHRAIAHYRSQLQWSRSSV
ncbi:hypothetical protein Prum_043710 [Phytohabitans rumicis]|uniref:Uncharacterized protein n=1 Tax=Phytohabitans rumicis TaxID=1076125 RepID=A0A6V8L7W2_9ACTN|nr:hypothetical protein Prum_043710 [Phytohabitans rumicis]